MLKPALTLMAGRTLGYAVFFVVPIILVRLFSQEQFGTYKQVFLLYGTILNLAQVGMSESLFYFIPGSSEEAGRYVCNSILVLGGHRSPYRRTVISRRGHDRAFPQQFRSCAADAITGRVFLPDVGVVCVGDRHDGPPPIFLCGGVLWVVRCRSRGLDRHAGSGISDGCQRALRRHRACHDPARARPSGIASSSSAPACVPTDRSFCDKLPTACPSLCTSCSKPVRSRCICSSCPRGSTP